MMTEQQEFLDILKDPTEALLKKAVRKFFKKYEDSLDSATVYKLSEEGEYSVDVYGYDEGDLLSAIDSFSVTVRKYLGDTWIQVRTFPGRHDVKLRRITFFVTQV